MVTRRIHCRRDPAEVDAVLADGWRYPAWVVGASRVRRVDQAWPAVGSRIHHSAGVWPLVIDDTTEVLEREPGVRWVLDARGWPLGRARVVVEFHPTPTGCEIVLSEDAAAGPGRLVPAPLRAAALAPRNDESLRRLSLLVERRAD